MFKLIYAALMLLFSTAMFLFNKNKPSMVCRYELSGIVKEAKGNQGLSLYIEGQDQKKYVPQIESENIVIVSGTRIKVCYDKSQVMPDQTVRIRINDVVYLP
ncbi:MAG: hypothetical protein MUE58_01425 [Chitinophagaceae bacterium]|jgi:hypothetical protein|nr:hypothetical protein [Chitinophagaceae bacterium]